jgi:hypothetical protein
MARAAAGSGSFRAALGLALLAGVFLAFAIHWQVWTRPSASGAGILLLVLSGLVLGVFGLLRRPSWQVRGAAVASLVVATSVLNAVWLPALDRNNKHYSLVLQEDDRLARRYADHHHWIPHQKSGYFLLAEFLEGKQIRYVEGTQLSPWRLLTLVRASEVVEIPPPDYPLPSPQELVDRFRERHLQKYSPNWKGEERSYRMVGIVDRAESADYFVVLALQGIDFVIPGPIWESVGLQQIMRQRSQAP